MSRNLATLQTNLLNSCKAALLLPENKDSRFVKAKMTREYLDEKVFDFSDLCRISGKQKDMHWDQMKHDGHTNTLNILFATFKQHVRDLSGTELQPVPSPVIQSAAEEAGEELQNYDLTDEQGAVLTSFGFDLNRLADLDKIHFYDLLEIGLYGRVDKKNKTDDQLATRKRNLIYLYAAERQSADKDFFKPSAPEIIATVVCNNRAGDQQKTLPFTESFHVYSQEQLYSVEFNITRLPESLSVRFDVRSDIPKDPYNYYGEEGYDVVVPQRTWGSDEGERRENFKDELRALEKKNKLIPSEEIQVKISSMFSTLETIVSQNRLLPFYIEKYFMLPVKLYLHLQEKLEEVSLLFDRDENKQVEYFVKAKLLENIKDHLKTTKTVAGFFCAYKIAIDSLGLTPFSEFTSPLYSDLVPDDVNNSKYFKKYIYAEIVKDVLPVAVSSVVWPADFAKPALPISKKGVDFEREIFFDVLSRSQNGDTSNIWKLVRALTIANNFLLPKEKQRQPHEHLLFILGMEKSDSVEFGFTISPANAESLLQVFLEKNSNNSFNITKDSLEKSFLYTVKKLSKHQFTGDNWVFHSSNAFLEDQIFLSKLKEEFQKKNPDFSFILDLEEPIDSCVSFFRALGRSHKSDLAGRDGNTKRLKTILAILKENFDIIPKDVKEALFGSKTKEQMTHFDLLAYATLGDGSAQDIVSSIERSTLYQNLIYLYSEENQAYLDGKDPKSGWDHQDSEMEQILKYIKLSSVNLKKCKISNAVFVTQPQQSWQDFQAMLRDVCKPTAIFSMFASPRAEFHRVLLLETCTMESLLAKIEADLADPKKRQDVIDLFAPLGLVSCEGDIVTGSVPKKVEVVVDPVVYRSISTLGVVRH